VRSVGIGVKDLYLKGREAQSKGEYDEAQRLFVEALNAYRSLAGQPTFNEQLSFAGSMYQLSTIAESQGLPDIIAQHGYEQSAKMYEELGNNAAAEGDHSRAAQLHEQSRFARQSARRQSGGTTAVNDPINSSETTVGEITGAAAALGGSLLSAWLRRKSRARRGASTSAQQATVASENKAQFNTLSAQRLTAEYRANRATTNRKYAGTILTVQGKIRKMGYGGFTLDAEANQDKYSRETEGSWDLACGLSDPAQLAYVQPGQVVVVSGRYEESALSNPRLVKCRLL
jgi:hypothetical protein